MPRGRLLARLDFLSSRDTLYLLGDLVTAGPPRRRSCAG